MACRLQELLRDIATPGAVGLPPKATRLLLDWFRLAGDLNEVPPKAVIYIPESYRVFHARATQTARGRLIGDVVNLSRHRRHTLIFDMQNRAHLDRNIISEADMVLVKEPRLTRNAQTYTLQQPTAHEKRTRRMSSDADGAVHWGYGGALGPENWGDIEGFELCREGLQQSPIDINYSFPEDLSDIEFHYRPSPLTVINNGHTIQANVEPGSSITIDGETYEMLQFHFHTPSENLVNHESYAMEGHLPRGRPGSIATMGNPALSSRPHLWSAPTFLV